MSVPKWNVKDLDQYWNRLSANLSYLCRSLQGKAEYGSCVSERGIQSSVLFTAEKIARELSMNVDIVSSLCQAVALCFPERGHAELSIIKEFIKKNNLNIALDTLELDAIEHCVYESGATVTPEFDIVLHKYYSDDETVREVNLVRFLQKYLNLNRNLLSACSFNDSGEIIDGIMKQAKTEFETSYRLLPDPDAVSVAQNIKDEIENKVHEFIEYYKDDISKGIYEVITC